MPTIVKRNAVKRQPGYLYYVTKQGHVAKTKMGGKRRKKRK